MLFAARKSELVIMQHTWEAGWSGRAVEFRLLGSQHCLSVGVCVNSVVIEGLRKSGLSGARGRV